MKKIYMILAAMTLLSMSLNAQTLYEKVTSSDQLEIGSKYIFVYENGTSSYAMGALTSSGYGNATPVAVTLNGTTVTANGNVVPFTLGQGSSSSYYTFAFPNGTLLGGYRTGSYSYTYYFYEGGSYTNWRIYNSGTNYYAMNYQYDRYVKYYNSQFVLSNSSSATYAYLYVEASTDPVITTTSTAVTLKCQPGQSVNQTISVTGRNLTENITASISRSGEFSVNPTSLGTSGGDLTVTYSPTAVGTHTATLTLSSTGADPVTITLNGTSSNDVTVCDGGASNSYLPVYGFYFDEAQTNQMLYPASMFTGKGLDNKTIKSITFYPTTSGYTSGINFYYNSSYGDGTVTLKLANMPSGTTGYDYTAVHKDPAGGFTTVKTITMPSTAQTSLTEWVFDNLEDDFVYNGGDLLIEVVTGGGQYANTYFAGESQSNYMGYYSYGSTSRGQQFLPKVTFAYEDTQPRHDLGITLSEPTAVLAGENATITATVTNNGNQTESGYTVTFSDGTNTFSTQTGGTLNPGDTQTFTATYATSAAGTVTITATVACTGDADATNDVATTNLTVNAPVHDLGITLSAPAEVVGGNAATVTATVTNNGDYTETGYTVTIYADGTAISTPTAVSLAPGASTTFTVDYATTSAQVGTTVNFTATVACTGDADATNNSAAASTAVITLPPPINVVAVPDNTNMSATVTWDAPVIAPVVETVVEDFEDTSVFPTFTTGGVNANTRTGAFGSWTLYDGNGSNVYGMSDVDFGTDVEGTPYAWMPFDLTATTPVWSVTNISAHSGTQFMNSVSARQTTTNHWLISPELSGNAQTISWYDAEMKTNWGAESYEVLYSTTDNTAPSSFTSLGTYSADALTWGTAETANLPAGAKYFAIRHTQNDGFGLMIDDVTYEGLVPGVQPISYKVYLDGVLQGTVNAGDPLTYPLTNLTGGQHTVEVSAVYPGNIESTKTPYQFTITAKTATPTISGQVDPNNENNYVITATGNGTVTLTVGNETVSGNGSASITVPRSDVNQTVTATATAQESGKEVSDPATETFTVPLMQTATPVISTSSDGESVTITATGNGTVTLTVGNQTVSGPGSASITIPCGVTGTTVTATATAQETGKAVSETATQQVPIPAGEGWTQMDGTYDNPNTLLSFEKDGEEIMLIDQFLASTYNNAHPGGYDYTIMETVENEDKVSPPVHIPVYKTNSSIQGLYTKNQVDADTLMNYRADVLNTEMDYDVNPGEHTYFYGLYRSDLNADYPDVDIPHRISQLQKYDEIVGEHVQFFFTETYNSGIAPMYDGIGSQMVERLDLNYVEGELNDSLAYVPVIWTFGLYTARGDGKNNSYGSDIKREKLGGVDINFIEGTLSTNNTTHPNDYGMWEAPNGVQYCVYTPYMRVTGIKPVSYIANDGDEVTYEPYMYRVWCIYPDARDFARDNRVLVDNGALPDTMLLETVYVTDPTVNSVFFGKEQWVEADGKLPYAFGVPVSVADNPSALEFVIRFYYKKSVDEGNGAKGQRDGDDEEYFIVENRGNGQDIGTAINEMFFDQLHGEIVGVTYVNTLGMQSDKPFDGINIVVTRYSDGTTSTSKVRY